MSAADTAQNKNTLVILQHGFCRGAADMQFWKRFLQKDFPNILTPDLPTTHSSFQQCLHILAKEIAAAEPEKYSSILIAGHSMGGLLARAYLQQNKHANVKRLVCVGTPHYGSKLADIALRIPGCGRIWQPLHALTTAARTQVTSPDIPGLEIGAVVSSSNRFWAGRIFLTEPADGFVERSSAIPPDAVCVTEVAASHIKMQFDTETAARIRTFFLSGNFGTLTVDPRPDLGSGQRF